MQWGAGYSAKKVNSIWPQWPISNRLHFLFDECAYKVGALLPEITGEGVSESSVVTLQEPHRALYFPLFTLYISYFHSRESWSFWKFSNDSAFVSCFNAQQEEKYKILADRLMKWIKVDHQLLIVQ